MDVSYTYNEHIMPGPTLCQTLLRRSSSIRTVANCLMRIAWLVGRCIWGDPSQLHPVVKFRFF